MTLPSFLQLVVVRADLNGHLKALKDYFLLEKGDFFQVNCTLIYVFSREVKIRLIYVHIVCLCPSFLH